MFCGVLFAKKIRQYWGRFGFYNTARAKERHFTHWSSDFNIHLKNVEQKQSEVRLFKYNAQLYTSSVIFPSFSVHIIVSPYFFLIHASAWLHTSLEVNIRQGKHAVTAVSCQQHLLLLHLLASLKALHLCIKDNLVWLFFCVMYMWL